MSGTNSPQGGLTRRSFLKTTGAVAGAAAIGSGATLELLSAEKALAESSAEEKAIRSSCRGNCGGKCPTQVIVREGKVVRVAASELPGEDNARRRICVKGYSQPQRVYDPDRLKYPMKRTGERGAGQWERISWDEALDIIAEKINAAVSEYGGSSVGVWSSYGSFGVLHGNRSGSGSVAYGRFITSLGATVFGPAADWAQIYVQAALLGVMGNDSLDLLNSKTIMAWGGNPAEAYVHDWQFVCQAREKGAKLITIDPQFTASAMHSDMYVPIRPGTDGALMLAMANWIIDNDLVDIPFMKQKTVSPFLIKEDGTYLRMSDLGTAPTEGPVDPRTGKPSVVDPNVVWDVAAGAPAPATSAADPALLGVFEAGGHAVQTVYQKVKDSIAEYTVQKAAEICDIDAGVIEELSRIYATEGPVAVMTFQGIGHHVNSHHNYKNLALIAALTGNAGKPGAMMTRGTCGSYQVNSSAYSAGKPGLNIVGMYLPEIMETGKWAGKDLNIRVLWCSNGNMLSCESGRLELIEAVKKVDFVVAVDTSMTDTTQWADIVLPVPHVYETTDFDVVCMTPYPPFFNKVIDPLYESKSDLDIMRELAPRLNLGDLYDKTDEEFLQEVLDTKANVAAGGGYQAFSDNKLGRNHNFTEAAMVDTFKASSTRRLQYYLEKPAPRCNFGQKVEEYEKMPYYEHANEAYWENPLREKYPLMGCSEHHKYHVHSQCAYTPALRELEPEPLLKVNAADAAARGIEQGDLVRVFNDRGHAVLKALVTNGIKPGVVSIPHGWQAEQFVEGHTQDLTNRFMNDFCSNSAFYDFLCEVEKYEGGSK